LNIALSDVTLMHEGPIGYAATHDIVYEKSAPRQPKIVDGALAKTLAMRLIDEARLRVRRARLKRYPVLYI
jgi:hypothetical protein